MAREELVYAPPKTVADFMLSDAKFRVIMGPVGSGKSVGCVMEIARRAKATPAGKDGVRRSRWAVIRNTMPMLRDTTIKTFLDWMRPGVAGEWRTTDKTFIIRFEDVEAEVMFRALDDANDVAKLLSLELTGAWINECRSVPKDIIEPLVKRCGRFPRKNDVGEYWHGIWADTNPPNINSWWWQMMEGRDEEGKPKPNNWKVFKQPSGRGPLAENLENLPEGYYNTEGMSDDFVRVYVDGEYGLSKLGVPVYDKTFKRAMHVVQGSAPVPFAMNPVIIGMDFGRSPAATLGQVQGGGRVVVLDECVGFNMGLEVFLREKLRPLLQSGRYDGQRLLVIGDPAGTGKDAYSEENAYDVLKRLGFDARPAVTNKPAARLAAVERGLLELSEGKPALTIDEGRCPMLVGGFEHGYVYTEVKNANGEIKAAPNKNEYSHVHDSLQYLMLHATTLGGALKPFSRELYFSAGADVMPQAYRPTAGWT